jgi:Na+/melibiose symporter-like transporter
MIQGYEIFVIGFFNKISKSVVAFYDKLNKPFGLFVLLCVCVSLCLCVCVCVFVCYPANHEKDVLVEIKKQEMHNEKKDQKVAKTAKEKKTKNTEKALQTKTFLIVQFLFLFVFLFFLQKKEKK